MTIEKVDRTVGRLLDALGLATVAAQARLATSWEEVVGPLLATRTCPARLKAGILTICAVSPAWAQELSLSRSTVLGRIDAVLGPGKVREVRVVVGPVPEDERPAAARGEAPPQPAGATPGPGPEGIDSLADPEMRRLLASLSRKAAGRS
ncbi:MAG: DUF721 domain-containing protein [Gemmatimonadota bacterium]